MKSSSTNEAAHTATTLLTSIERNTRVTLMVVVVATVLLAVVTFLGVFVGIEYMRARTAMQTIGAEMAKLPSFSPATE